MKNDVLTNKEYLIYITNEQAKVDRVKSSLYYHADCGDLKILNHQECNGGKHYVWHIESWDAAFIGVKNSLRGLIRGGICSRNEIKIVTDFQKKEA